MKLMLTFLLILLFTSPVFSYSDPNLLKSDRSLAYFLMPISDSRHISSGLVYNQKLNRKLEVEGIYTTYQSVYLYTRNLTKLKLNLKYTLLSVGPFFFKGLGGGTLIYSTTTGGGFAGNVGIMPGLRFFDQFSFSVPILGLLYTDGFEMTVTPNVGWQPNFLPGFEAFGGFRLEAAMLSSDSNSGQMTDYYIFGIRKSL